MIDHERALGLSTERSTELSTELTTSQSPSLPLSRERALVAAMALADADGIAALSMRKIARELGVEAMSLYHHVSNKADILDGMVDLVFAEVDLPDCDVGWKEAMAFRAHALRAALVRHPWALGILESRSSPGPATLRHHDAVIGCLRRARFSVEMAAHAFSLIDSYIYGFALQEENLPFDESDDLDQVIDAMMPAQWSAEYPHLAEMTTEYILRPGYSYGNEFDRGLGIILDALQSLVTD